MLSTQICFPFDNLYCYLFPAASELRVEPTPTMVVSSRSNFVFNTLTNKELAEAVAEEIAEEIGDEAQVRAKLAQIEASSTYLFKQRDGEKDSSQTELYRKMSNDLAKSNSSMVRLSISLSVAHVTCQMSSTCEII